MIRTALEFIKKELESYITGREQDAAYTAGNVVDLKSIVLPNGNINITDTTHITMMLTGIEEERKEGKRPVFVPAGNKEFFRLNPPVELDLFILFAAHNKDYETALRDLSDVIAFFQANIVFDEQRYPSLNSEAKAPTLKPWQLIDRLSFRLHNMSFEQQNNLWAMLGSKYIPSVVYKMNMITVFETRGKDKVPPVTEINFAGN